jgi:hypothetical protein
VGDSCSSRPHFVVVDANDVRRNRVLISRVFLFFVEKKKNFFKGLLAPKISYNFVD